MSFEFWFWLVRMFILFCLLIGLAWIQVGNYRLLRELKESYKKQHGREYSYEPGQIKNLSCQLRCLLSRFFGLSGKV